MKMQVHKKKLDGLLELVPETFGDERGFLTRLYHEQAFKELGLPIAWVDEMHHHTRKKNTLRGIYFTLPPFSEMKFIRAIKGEMLWVSVDVRKNSKAFGNWDSTILTEKNKNILITAQGFAHGCVSLTDEVDLVIKSDNYFSLEHGVGIIWNDEDLNIDWNLDGATPLVSVRDMEYPSFRKFKEKYIK